MCAYKADVRHSADEDDHSHYPVVVAPDIEDISAILHVVCRWERLLNRPQGQKNIHGIHSFALAFSGGIHLTTIFLPSMM